VVKAKKVIQRQWFKATLAISSILIVAAGAVAIWNFYYHSTVESASKKDIDAFWKQEWLPLPEKPSIAVLPFDNMSNDPKEDYFSDGLTEDLITDLAKISGLFVIARHSSFHYKGKTVDVQQVGRELGVRYLLEGSVRKGGSQLRINAQLIDAVNGNHLWSERYDLDQKDLFKVQNEILEKIVTAVDIKIVEGEQAKLYRKSTDNPEAYIAFAKGLNYFRQFRRETNSLARQYLLKAIDLDPGYTGAMGLVGSTHWADARFGWSDSREQSIEKGKKFAQRALSIDKDSFHGLAALSTINLLEKNYDRAVELRERAYSIRPNGAESNALLALTYSLVGREEEALPHIKTAMRLSPFYSPWYLGTLCDIFRLMGRYDEAIAVARVIIDLNLPYEIEIGRINLAAMLIELGRD
jgi:adenylate cyclase